MSKGNWNINSLLSENENILYQCELDNDGESVNVCLTNYRIIWIYGKFVDCRLIKFISKYGVFVGYDEFNEPNDIGVGEYGVYFGDTQNYESMWFTDGAKWREFYMMLSKAIMDDLCK